MTSEHDALYRRVLRRETHVSRSGTVVVAMVVVLVVAAAAVFAATLVFLDQNVAGIDPRAVVDAAAGAPRGLIDAVVIGVGAVVGFVGLVFLLQGVLPQRRPRHQMASRRLAVVVDDEVLASAAARAARGATRLGPDAAVGTVGRRTVDVVLRPAAGVDVPAVAATEAVEREFADIATVPAVTARVRVQPTGRVDG
ncbi:hypothetical protein EDF24_1100 [Curtobacterium sp. PhB130]|uniref:hypothetical protein n=1 Tax=unclassified Curtobacterium TaxID=257496 RepID=UPI000F4B22C7|nr:MULTISPECIES: hypothetical protein [unclassified Curtobacterium]ROP65091.1 hypothetical protein EDF55_1744 [Curtobacterium sp. ZW137]ROS78325.1 hypothetical protein EDF24_1100 [Curtobacterium sp. PhB130]TCK65357.1 hypothetical protein EDF27_0095 [Curtobacterium sp. PhB136]